MLKISKKEKYFLTCRSTYFSIKAPWSCKKIQISKPSFWWRCPCPFSMLFFNLQERCLNEGHAVHVQRNTRCKDNSSYTFHVNAQSTWLILEFFQPFLQQQWYTLAIYLVKIMKFKQIYICQQKYQSQRNAFRKFSYLHNL